MSDNEYSDFEQKVKASLNANIENLDANTRKQLTTTRHKALNESTKKPWLKSWQQFWLPSNSIKSRLAAAFLLFKSCACAFAINNNKPLNMQDLNSMRYTVTS